METQNITGVSQFFLKGLTDDPVLQTLLFGLFLSVYLVTIFGNILIILAVSSDTHLQTPMYIFLSNLSFNEICLCTTIIPNMLVNIQTRDQSISYTGCFTQVCFVNEFSSLESCILAAMAYDRYMAICFPLSYTAIMNPQFCALLILFSFLMSTVSTAMLCLMELQLSFCTDLEIPLFFCELAQVMKLACSDTLINTIMTYIATLVFGGMPISAIIFSYIQIVLSVLKISSVRGRYKAFSTCGSHLSAVSLFYGAAFWVYISSVFTDSHKKIEVAYVMYTMVPEMLNPFIYSLRNKDMKGTLKKLIRRYCPFYDM